MTEQIKLTVENQPEESIEQIYQKLNKTHDEIRGLMEQVHRLRMKTEEEGLSEEEFNAIINERNNLTAELNKKWEAGRQLEEQWQLAEEKEMKILEEEWKKSSQTLG